MPSVAIEINPPCQSERENPGAGRFANHSVGNLPLPDFPPPSYSSLSPTSADASATPVSDREINDATAQSSALHFANDRTKATSGSQPAPLYELGICDNEFDSRMAAACLSGDIKEVDALLDIRPTGIHRVQKYPGEPFAMHPLHLAAKENNTDLIASLCEKSEIPINVITHDGQTPLMMAAAKNLEAMKLLLKHPRIDINAQNNAKQTALLIGIIHKNAEAVSLLLDHGANIKTRTDKLHNTLLYAAIAGDKALNENIDEQHNTAVLELLLNRGCDPNKKLCSIGGITPLHVAAHFEDIGSIDLLIAHGADVRKKSNRGAAPMHFAALTKNIEVVKRLLQHGATLEDQAGGIDRRFYLKRVGLGMKQIQDPKTRDELRANLDYQDAWERAGNGCYGTPLSFLKNEDHGILRAMENEQIMLRKNPLPEKQQ
ncbi:ankyrin repeat domain-containing protein [Endozoicomonas sp. SCSIO W0465]|uniref:ankyrin repeat domain-containing protein n=1 Tax=Endozoicomonas sp. SCSIO W0465 TaxID=2918516 RepID=UPI0020760E24|nr:ankyrin repeat domain-containing protein [Endozoicomonas sp. SCSIO W0465]USE37204.1 ankyrin repeat domain-containing protein [Endozoicomonas sp. SCSIO W0465]